MEKYKIIAKVNDLFRRFGFQISAYGPSNPTYQSRRALMDPAIASVIDVGANTGQYATHVRSLRKNVKIYSFEPQKRAFDVLYAQAFRDPLWECHHVGLGAAECEMEMQISENDQCSSLLMIEEAHLRAAPASRIVSQETVRIVTLDSILGKSAEVKFLKMDCQGFEADVLRGAKQTLETTRYVQVEASLVPLYAGAPTVSDLLGLMDESGFEPLTFLAGFSDREEARMLQVDLVFKRRK